MVIIEPNTVMRGDLTILGTVALDGRFEGRIVCSRLEIGADGYLLGDVVAGDIVVKGQIIGSVSAERVLLRNSALVEGELAHVELSMEEDATLVGHSRRQSRVDMPAAYRELGERARRTEEELQQIETESRIRQADEAIRLRPHFERLRARFPGPAAMAGA